MYSYRARWYLPEMGGFGERDPVGYADSDNLMQVLSFNAPNLTDPFGKTFTDWGLSKQYEVPRKVKGGQLTFGVFVDAWAANTVPAGPGDLGAANDGKGIHLGVDWQFWIRRDGTTLAGTFAYDNLDAVEHRVAKTHLPGPFGRWGILGGGGSVSAGINVAKYRGPEKDGYWDLKDSEIVTGWLREFKDVAASLPAFSLGLFWSPLYTGVSASGGPFSLGIGVEASITYYRSTTIGTELGRWKTFVLDSLASVKGAAKSVAVKAEVKVSKVIDGSRAHFRRVLEPNTR